MTMQARTPPAKQRHFEQSNVEILDHPPYSPDLRPNDFFTLLKIKQSLRGQRFSTPEGADHAYKSAILTTPTSEWNKCFTNWFERMEKCIAENSLKNNKC